MVVITLEGDVKVRTFRPPPPGLDTLCTSAAELERYGFPARSDDPHLLERYQRVFKRLKAISSISSQLSRSTTTGRPVRAAGLSLP
jgi:hypothetical protein